MRDYLLRQALAADAAAAQGCATCPHLVLDHRELPAADPRYRPLQFHCAAEDCGCVVYGGAR